MTFDEMVGKCYEYADALITDLDEINKKHEIEAIKADEEAYSHFGLIQAATPWIDEYKNQVAKSPEQIRDDFAKAFMRILLNREEAEAKVKSEEGVIELHKRLKNKLD